MTVGRKQHESLDHVAQFADIPRPRIRLKRLQRVNGEGNRFPSILCAHLRGKMFHQCRNVVAPLSQWWKHQREDMDPMEQILPEFLLTYTRFQIAVCRNYFESVDAH